MKRISKIFKRLTWLAIFLIIVGVVGAMLVGYEEAGALTHEETVTMLAVNRVQIRTTNQRVLVSRTSDSLARIVVSGISNADDLTVQVVGDVLQVENRPQTSRQIINFSIGFGSVRSLGQPAILEVYLPEAVYEQVVINSTNGRIDVADLEVNDLRINTTNSPVELRNIVGNVDAKTTNGRIVAFGITGDDARLETRNGRIELSEITANIDAKTTNGRIVFSNQTIDQNVNLESTNGAIEVSLFERPEHATFNLSTTHGRITIFGNNNTVEQFGDGSHTVRLRTTNGRITVE